MEIRAAHTAGTEPLKIKIKCMEGGGEGGSSSWYRNKIFQDFDEMKVAHTTGTETITITVQGRRSGLAECAER